jgi:ATPase family protein associated with various cellular activities (AAA)/winged helix domain-containing protein
MTDAMTREAWRRANADWMRLRLCHLRLRLNRHALSLVDGQQRRVDWLLAGTNAELVGAPPAGAEAELERLIAEHPLSAAGEQRASLWAVSELAGLTPFESDVLLLAAAPSLDAAFGRAYAELHDDRRRDSATLHLALSLFREDVTDRLLAADCLLPSRPLRAFHLIETGEDAEQPLLARRLGVDERMTDYLRGINRCDTRLASLMAPVRELPATDSTVSAGREAAALITRTDQWITINIVGAVDSAIEAARLACVAAGLQPFSLDLPRFAAFDAASRVKLVGLLGREALLAGMAIVVKAGEATRDSALTRAVDELIAALSAALFVISPERWPGQYLPVLRTAGPTRGEQRALWHTALTPYPNSVNGEVDAISQQFDFGPAAIADVVSRAAWHGGEVTGPALWTACRDQVNTSLDDLAQRIRPAYTWDDIVVADDVRAQLGELGAQVQRRARVYDSWGFGAKLNRGRGITALFAGPSGTGKTMAAEILAAHLDLDLYRIDLAGVVSKYVGETEKNLRQVFDAAERSGVILFFDEADALFGTRTEVRDSHDRYANLEINYLLQRMENYTGLAVLATNRRTSLDGAFLRRLRFVIDFRLPGPDDRRRIWEHAFPRQAALDAVDFSLLANLDLTGGSIKAIAVNAAFLAASEDVPIGMPHVVRAATREYVKLSKPISAAEFGPYYAVARR